MRSVGYTRDSWGRIIRTNRPRSATPTLVPILKVPVTAPVVEATSPPLDTPPHKRPILIMGMLGLGDNIHQRAILRVLMEKYDVWLESCHANIYHDLMAKGLKVLRRQTNLRTQAKTLRRENHLFTPQRHPLHIQRLPRFWYTGQDINRRAGSTILSSMFTMTGTPMPEFPDFSLPIKVEWRTKLHKMMETWPTNGKPLLVYRPIVVRREWDAKARNPDPLAYEALFDYCGS